MPKTFPRRDGLTRPAHTADTAQAQAFVHLLQREVVDLEQLIASAEARWLQRCERSHRVYHRTPDSLVRFRERLAEVQKLIENLRTRFLLD